MRNCCSGPSKLQKALEERPMKRAEYEERKKIYRFGIRKLSPEWCQVVFRNPYAFTVFIFLFAAVEGSLVSGLTSVSLSSIERRYQFTGVMAGLIASTFDITVLLSVLPMSYFGGRGHKPRWVGIGAIIHGIGALVFSLPQYVGGTYSPNIVEDGEGFCSVALRNVSSAALCDNTGGPSWVYLFFIIGNILMGLGAAPLFTIGTAFIDEIVWPKQSPIFLGVAYISTVAGPAIGFLMGGSLLTVYVDPSVSTTLIDGDPAFVGAWWIGFVIMGILSIIMSIPLLLFPRELPECELIREERMKDHAMEFTDFAEETGCLGDLKEAPKHAKQVLLNPTWLTASLSVGFQAVSLVGLVTFGPKYLETQFGVPASQGSLIAGAIGVVGSAAGIIIGAIIQFALKADGKTSALIAFVSSAFSTLLVLGLLFTCPNASVVGVPNDGAVGYLLESTANADIGATCSLHCGCTTTTYQPVCDPATGYTYFSPCHAGCENSSTTTNEYERCSCITSSNGNFTQALNGKCENNCNFLGPALLFLFLFILVTFIAQIPGLVLTLRTVADEQRYLALAAQSVLYRLLGTIPGPLIFGALFDSGCILWAYECGVRGNCWEYDNKTVNLRIFIVAFVTNVINTLLIMLAWLMFGRTWCCKTIDKGKSESDNDTSPTSDNSDLKQNGSPHNPPTSQHVIISDVTGSLDSQDTFH